MWIVLKQVIDNQLYDIYFNVPSCHIVIIKNRTSLLFDSNHLPPSEDSSLSKEERFLGVLFQMLPIPIIIGTGCAKDTIWGRGVPNLFFSPLRLPPRGRGGMNVSA